MTARLDQRFAELRAARRTGLVTYVTAGDPDPARSAGVLRALDQAGADVLEVGVPFSDPLADGPVIQRASRRALAGGTTLASTLALIREVRPSVEAPIVLFTYANPVFRMGPDPFARAAHAAGVDGVLVLDLPIEESGPLLDTLADASGEEGIAPIFLLSPTTTDARIRAAGRLGRGFLYAIARLGVTGARDTLEDGARTLAGRVRAVTDLPLAVGFGISRPEHVREVGRWADAAVVGSALVEVVEKHADAPDLPERAGRFAAWLKSAAPA